MPSRSLQHLPPHHPLDRRTAARRAGLDAWLAGLARDTGTLSRRCKTTRRNILLKPALSASCRKTNMTENKSGCLVPHTTLRGAGGRLGHCQASGHPESCRVCPACRSRGRYPASSLRPRRLSAGKAIRIHHGLGQAGRHTGRAGRLTAENLAASPRQSRCACGHPRAPGEPWTARSACVTGSWAGPGTRPRPWCSLQPYSLAERGKFQLPGSWPATRFPLPARP